MNTTTPNAIELADELLNCIECIHQESMPGKSIVDTVWFGPAETLVDRLTHISEGVRRLSALLEARGEAVGTVFTMEALGTRDGPKSHVQLNRQLPAGTKLYTHPTADLTDEQIDALFIEVHEKNYGHGWVEASRAFARAILAKVKGV